MPDGSTTYRTDWSNDAGQIDVKYCGTSLALARATARKKSAAFGAAYVIRTTYGQDDGQIAYTNGDADSRDWEV